MTRVSLLASAALVALLASPAAALEACAVSAGLVDCPGTDPDGVVVNDPDVLVRVGPNGSVLNANGDAVRLNGATPTVQNEGRIDGSDEGVDLRADDGVIDNFAGATITGGDRGVDVDGRSGLRLDNQGLIEGRGSDAIRTGDDTTVTNGPGATIDGADEGIQAGDGLTLTNEGAILAADEGVEAGDDAIVINAGTISAADDALQTNARADITNDGEIVSSENDAIDIDDGRVENNGVILTTDGGEDGIDFDPVAAGRSDPIVSEVINNAGAVIEGAIGVNVDEANDQDQTIVNAGTIIGRSGVALFLEDGDDALTLLDGGVIDGDALFGAGDDTLELSGIQGSAVGGGDLFDGGEDFDTILFSDLSTANVLTLSLMRPDGSYNLRFRNSDGSASRLLFARFELFGFRDADLSFDDLDAIAPVPLPATLPLLAVGGLALAALRRRRR
jgi:hypothetical protein